MAELEDNLDPFHPDNVGGVQTVVLMRIYDVLMAILNDSDPHAALALHELHRAGRIVGSFPVLDIDVDQADT